MDLDEFRDICRKPPEWGLSRDLRDEWAFEQAQTDEERNLLAHLIQQNNDISYLELMEHLGFVRAANDLLARLAGSSPDSGGAPLNGSGQTETPD